MSENAEHTLKEEIPIIGGDWNARHKQWDQKSNRRGNQLARWAIEKKWEIVHRNGPTFETKRYRSNIDFFISKGIQAAGVKAPEDIWTGGTQHRPVTTNFSTREVLCLRAKPNPASVSKWRETEMQKMVRSAYR